MAKIVIAGDAIVVTSALKLEDIRAIEKYRPNELVLKGGEDGKEPIFAVGTTAGAGNINAVGAKLPTVLEEIAAEKAAVLSNITVAQ